MTSPILVVDDEPALCRVLSILLARLGRPVLTFTDPREAVEWLVHDRPCIVICDFRMPWLTGADVLRHVPDDVPFVLVSGDLAVDLAPSDRIAALLAKPVRPEMLLETVSRLLSEQVHETSHGGNGGVRPRG